ncbi:endonuclease [Exiguobacterium sp. s143]|uniref:endonuclease n=2 Tax=unclassified Exiguobacterium TaxID=2644629 RepID=UPI00203731CB|nr:endonuclease [Exiguobacterium sp. s143]
MLLLNNLSSQQQAILLASILGDGEITKCYSSSRRKNNSYREHFGESQRFYREWKRQQLPDLLYIRQNNLVSRSLPLFTELYPYFYPSDQKDIPFALLSLCNHPLFLLTLYLDDGSLIVSKRLTSKQQLIASPTIALYLQSFSKQSLTLLCEWLNHNFRLYFRVAKTSNGSGYFLRTTRFEDTMQFLDYLTPYVNELPDFSYKLDWKIRLKQIQQDHPHVKVLSAMPNRYFSPLEIEQLLNDMSNEVPISEIAQRLNRSTWSIYAKLNAIKKGHGTSP